MLLQGRGCKCCEQCHCLEWWHENLPPCSLARCQLLLPFCPILKIQVTSPERVALCPSELHAMALCGIRNGLSMLVRTNKYWVTCQLYHVPSACTCKCLFSGSFVIKLLNFRELSEAFPRALTTPKTGLWFFHDSPQWWSPVVSQPFCRGTSPWGSEGGDLQSLLRGFSILPPAAAFLLSPLPSPDFLAFPFLDALLFHFCDTSLCCWLRQQWR